MIHRLAMPTLLVTTLGGCGPGSIDLPEPPSSMAAVVAEYDHPTGSVPSEQIADTVAVAAERIDALEETRLGSLLADALGVLRKRLEAGGLPTDPESTPGADHAQASAYVKAHRVCRGWDQSQTAADPANGTLDLTVVLRQGEVQRQMWGIAAACQGRVDIAGTTPVNLYVDGTLGIYLDGPLPAEVSDARFAVHLDGSLGTEERRWQLAIDFRVAYPQVEVLLPVSDGHIVASGGPAGIQLRGSNGTFECSVEAGTCGQTTTAF